MNARRSLFVCRRFKTFAEGVPETPVLLYNDSGRAGCTVTGTGLL